MNEIDYRKLYIQSRYLYRKYMNTGKYALAWIEDEKSMIYFTNVILN